MIIHLPTVKCDFCHKKVSAKYFKLHIKSLHTGIKQPRKKSNPKAQNFQCSICSKILSTKSILKVHIGEHNKTIKCNFCEKLVGSQQKLKIHIKYNHQNLKEYICEVCGNKYAQQSNLKSHMKNHDPNRQRNLKCTQCDFATDYKQSLEKHLNSHKRKNAKIKILENPHKCPQCSSGFKSKRALDQHVSRVHPKVLLECDICGKEVKIKSSL